MKKLFIYMTVAGLFTFSSCGDNFLDSEPYTQLTDINFYKTPDDAYKSLVGVYDGMQRMYSSWNSFVVTSEIASDNAFGGFGNGDGYGSQLMDEFDQQRSPGDRNIQESNWIAYYRAIYRSNVLLSKLDGVSWGDDEALKPIYASEARFVRALAYFDLCRLFGNVVLITEPTTANLPQSEPELVYKVIAEDLKFAIENLPAVTYGEQSASDHGRITKWAAEALMGRVYLYYTGYYGKTDLAGVVSGAETLSYLEDVIANSGHALLEDFSTLWPAASMDEFAGERNIENILNVKFTYTSNYNGDLDGNHWLVMMGMRGSNYPPYGMGWGGATVNPDLWDAYDSDDTRKTASIISVADEGIAFDNTDQREFTGFYNKKYTPLSDASGSLAVALGGVDFQIGQYQDFVLIRYADVLLMAAELGSGSAQDYFDEVRMRAYGDGFESVAVTEDAILHERRLEFAFEGIRYWDLLRQGVDVAAATIAETTEVVNGGAEATKTITEAKILATQGLQQIPNPQITLSNGTLKQNPGWE